MTITTEQLRKCIRFLWRGAWLQSDGRDAMWHVDIPDERQGIDGLLAARVRGSTPAEALILAVLELAKGRVEV